MPFESQRARLVLDEKTSKRLQPFSSHGAVHGARVQTGSPRAPIRPFELEAPEQSLRRPFHRDPSRGPRGMPTDR